MNISHDCRKFEDLQQFLLGKLPVEDAEQVQQHLAACPRCLDTVSQLQVSDTLIEAMQSQARSTAQPENDVVEGLIGKLSGLFRNTDSFGLDVTSPGSSPSLGFGAMPREGLAFLAPPQSPDELGRLGGYRILKVLGAGGMGIVFEAEDPQLQRSVALKVMRPELAARPADRQRFLREARAMAAIEHDHIVAIYQVGEDCGAPFLAMQLLKGETLDDRLRPATGGTLPLPIGASQGEGARTSSWLPVVDILRIGREVAEGLAAAHAQGLTHRDVKPLNVWLEKNGRVKILDFGLARPVQDDAHLTQTGLVAGTPQYMSPEQATGQAIDHLSDLFSLGCLLYRISTGRLPFRGPNTIAVLRSLALDQPQAPHHVRSEIPRALSDLTMQLLEKEPKKRPQSAKSVVNVLANIEQAAGKHGLPMAKTSRRIAGFIAAIFLVLATPLAIRYAPAVYRIATNQGLLVIQTDDADVEVTVRQNGEKVQIVDLQTGNEITLRAGAYQLELSGNKNEELQIEKDQFTLIRGGKQIVKVWREEPASKPLRAIEPTLPAALPVVVISAGSRSEYTFATLSEAVAVARSGDVIEIRSNGPFVTETLLIHNKSLTLRAGPNCMPVIQLNADAALTGATLLSSNAPLVLEGLDLQRIGPEDSPSNREKHLVSSSAAPLHLVHCRVVFRGQPDGAAAVAAIESPQVELRKCLILCRQQRVAVDWRPPTGGQMTVEDCVISNRNAGLFVIPEGRDTAGVTVRLSRNTFVTYSPLGLYFDETNDRAAVKMFAPIALEASANIFDAAQLLGLGRILSEPVPLDFKTGQSELRERLAWRERLNLYGVSDHYLGISHNADSVTGLKTLAEWHAFWDAQETASLAGWPRFASARINAHDHSRPEELRAEDFRLQAGSPGHGADAGGRDLGPTLELVGPGPAYDNWKKTPEYQEWLKSIHNRP